MMSKPPKPINVEEDIVLDSISLEGLEFFAYHGYYKEERKIGNKFQVDIQVFLDLQKAAHFDKLGDTLNYEALYKIVADQMKQPSKLLENIALRIIKEIRLHFTQIDSILVTVSKFNPPVGGVCHRATVTLRG